MFLLEFEKELVKYFYSSPLRVKQAFFGNGNYAFLEGFSSVKTFPYLHISRELSSTSLGKSVVVYDAGEKRTFFPMGADYTVFLLVEKNVEMFNALSDLRFFVKKFPNVYVWYPQIEPKDINVGDVVYYGNEYDSTQPLDPEMRDLHTSTVDEQLYFMNGAKRVYYYKTSDDRYFSKSGSYTLGEITILDVHDFVRVPDPIRVELAFSSVTLEEIKGSLDTKGPMRCIKMKFHVDFFTESIDDKLPLITSIKVIIRTMPGKQDLVTLEVEESSDEV